MSATEEHAAPLGPVAGAACGLLAAVGYSAANAALRASVDTEPSLVAAVKAVPTILTCAPLLLYLTLRGRPVATSWKTFPYLVVGTVTGQLLGNFMFQVGLGIIGLALAVPLNLSAMIIAGAVLGKVLLGDPVSRRTIVAIVVLITAAVVLSLGSDASALEREVSWRRLAGGLVAIITSGVAYSFFGVTMRHSLRQGLTVPLAMFTSGIAGVVLLFPLAIQQAGWQQIASTPQSQWLMMGAAGLLNTAAFFMLSFALRAIPVVAVNLLNATQATLAALMGVMIFAEPLTGTLIGGSVLTVAGLVVLGSGTRRLAPGGARKQNPDTSPEQSPPLERSASPGESGGSRQATSPKSSTAPYRRTACDLSPANSDASKLGSSSRIS